MSSIAVDTRRPISYNNPMEIKTTFIDKTYPRYLRELLVDDVMVSRVTVVDLPMRVGSSIIRLGGIAGVETPLRENRMKGYSAALLNDTMNYMIREGYDASALFGIGDFYHRFGYVVYMAEPHNTRFVLQARHLPVAETPYTAREAAREDMRAITELYNDLTYCRTASIYRNPDRFEGFSKGSEWFTPVKAYVLELDGVFAGYFCVDDKPYRARLTEIGVTTAECYPAIINFLAELAKREQAETVALYLAPDDPFVYHMRRYGMAADIKYFNDGGSMMRIINKDSFLAKTGAGNPDLGDDDIIRAVTGFEPMAGFPPQVAYMNVNDMF